MMIIAASLALFIAFYLIGSLELRGQAETRQHALQRPTNLALVVALALAALASTSHSFTFVQQPLLILYLLAGLSVLLVVITLLDIETQMLSDALTVLLGLGGLAFGYLVSVDEGDMWPRIGLGLTLALLGAFLAGPYSRWRKRDMLGWGDVKFFAAAGLWLDVPQLPIFLAVAGIVGAINAMIYRVKTGRAETPFAPALCLSLWLCVIYGLTLEVTAPPA